ncbi:MAG: histidine kinase [Cytophagales bacterium]|nr:histidine kinase [Cytophagales bacterium]
MNSELLDLEWGAMSRENNSLFVPLIFGMTVNAVLFYCNAYGLIPQYLHTNQKKKYWEWTAFLLAGLTTAEITFDVIYICYFHLKSTLWSLPALQQRSVIFELIAMFGITDIFFNLSFWALAFLYRLPRDWIKNERQKQQLQRDKLAAELDFLKAQMNPHFLFNGINSIYHLMEKDVGKAQNILLRFSDLLRYQLYECKGDFIPLKKELQYVSNYLEIETIRKEEDALIKINLPTLNRLENGASQKIAPLLFSPFLENAFKYLSLHSEKTKNILDANIFLEGSVIHFSVKNSVSTFPEQKTTKPSNGIGLENAKRRLHILYPQKHKLSIEEKDNCFFVSLKIDLA